MSSSKVTIFAAAMLAHYVLADAIQINRAGSSNLGYKSVDDRREEFYLDQDFKQDLGSNFADDLK